MHGHLVRLLAAGALSLVLGLLLVWRKPDLRSFGIMNAAWGAIDLLIALAGLRDPRVADPAAMERFLWLNMGLNAGYIAVGVTMTALAAQRKNVKQFGVAIVVQGLILFVLDGYLLVSADIKSLA